MECSLMMDDVPNKEHITKFLILGSIAAFLSLGAVLKETPPVKLRVAIGRMICSSGLGGCAAFLGFFVPDVPFYVQMGLACGLATLGTDVVVALINKRYGRQDGGQ